MGMSLKSTNQDFTGTIWRPQPRSRPSQDPEARRPTEQAIWWSLHKVRHIATWLRVKFRKNLWRYLFRLSIICSIKFSGSVCYTCTDNIHPMQYIQQDQDTRIAEHLALYDASNIYVLPGTRNIHFKNWLFQSDDSKPLRMGNGHLTKDPLKKWLFRVPVYLQRNNTEKN